MGELVELRGDIIIEPEDVELARQRLVVAYSGRAAALLQPHAKMIVESSTLDEAMRAFGFELTWRNAGGVKGIEYVADKLPLMADHTSLRDLFETLSPAVKYAYLSFVFDDEDGLPWAYVISIRNRPRTFTASIESDVPRQVRDLIGARHYDAALSLIERALRDEHENTQHLLMRRAEVLSCLERWDEAIAVLDNAATLPNADSRLARHDRARCLIAVGRCAEAERELQALVAEGLLVHHELADLLLARGAISEAIAVLEQDKLVTGLPTVALARLLYADGRYKRLVEILAPLAAPTRSRLETEMEMWMLRALGHLELGDRASALEALRESERIEKRLVSSRSAALVQAEILNAAGEPKEAKAIWRRIVKRHAGTDDGEDRVQAGLALARLGKTTEAMLARTQAGNPDIKRGLTFEWLLHLARAMIALLAGDPQGAIADVDLILARFPRHAWALDVRARAHRLAGHRDHGLSDERLVGEISPYRRVLLESARGS